MDKKDYEEKFNEVKNEILSEIRKLIPVGQAHCFRNTFYIHFIDCDVATTELCAGVGVEAETVVFYSKVNKEIEKSRCERLFLFDSNSFIDILDALKTEILEDKILVLREIVKTVGGSIDFDGEFKFNCCDAEDGKSDISHSKLVGLRFNENGKLLVETIWCEDNDNYDYGEGCISLEEVDRIIDYVRNKTELKFEIKATEIFSRVFEITATDYDAAVEKVKLMLEKEPFNSEDSDGIQFT